MVLTKLPAPICVMQVDHDVVRIEQHDEVLREVGYCVRSKFCLGQQYRAGLGYGEGSAHDREIDVGEILRDPDILCGGCQRIRGR